MVTLQSPDKKDFTIVIETMVRHDFDHFKLIRYTFKGSISAIFIFDSLVYGCLLLKERIFSSRRKFFHFIVDPSLKGFCCPGKQQEIINIVPLCKNG